MVGADKTRDPLTCRRVHEGSDSAPSSRQELASKSSTITIVLTRRGQVTEQRAKGLNRQSIVFWCFAGRSRDRVWPRQAQVHANGSAPLVSTSNTPYSPGERHSNHHR